MIACVFDWRLLILNFTKMIFRDTKIVKIIIKKPALAPIKTESKSATKIKIATGFLCLETNKDPTTTADAKFKMTDILYTIETCNSPLYLALDIALVMALIFEIISSIDEEATFW